MRTVQCQETFIRQFLIILLLAFTDFLFSLGQELCGQLLLRTNQFLNQWLILLKHLVVTLGNGTTNNQRRTGIINQHGVHLIDDGVVVGPLYKVAGRNGHVVTQVVETELVVGTEGDICLIGLATSLRVGLVLVDTVHAQSVEHIKRPHPLRVTLGQIVVDGHHMDTITRQSIQEHRQRSNQCLTFTSGHLSNLTLMQYGTAKQLYVIVYHFPFQVVATGCPVVVVDGLVTIDGDEVLARVCCQLTVKISGRDDGLLIFSKPAGGLLDDGKDLG